ncbi:MAG: hypothetical protein U0R52_06110 [Solirubrobacterales bacterium]
MAEIANPDRLVRVAGAILGLCLAVALIVFAGPAGGHGGVLPAAVGFAARQDGALAMSPPAPEPFVRADGLRPGDRAAGTVRMANQTGVPVRARLRAAPSSTALDGVLMVRVLAEGRTLADGTLQSLRSGTRSLRLAPGASAAVRVVAWLPLATETGYEGRRVKVAMIAEEAGGW